MIKIENERVDGFQEAIRGVRNSWDSHEKSDSIFQNGNFVMGDADRKLLGSLVRAGDSHAKALRMITVWFDLTAPRYFYTEFDTYKHVVRCSESTMHTIAKGELSWNDFSLDGNVEEDKGTLLEILLTEGILVERALYSHLLDYLQMLAYTINDPDVRDEHRKHAWRTLIQLLPQSYNQKSTICTNYQTLRNMYLQRKGHKLSEWQEFRVWVETLPYAKELICCEQNGCCGNVSVDF